MSRQLPRQKRSSACQFLYRFRFALPWPILALALASCQTTTGKTTATTGREVCRIWGSVIYSGKGDTKLTIDQIRALNAKRDAYCEGKP